MAFATETFSDVNPLARLSFRPNATRGVIAGAALVGVGTVAFAWMVATVVTMQTMGMSLGSGNAISSLGPRDIALTNAYENQINAGTFLSSTLKGGRVWKRSPIADIGRFAVAPANTQVAATSLSAATLIERFRHPVSVALAKTGRIAAQAAPIIDPTAPTLQLWGKRPEGCLFRWLPPMRGAFPGLADSPSGTQIALAPSSTQMPVAGGALGKAAASVDQNHSIAAAGTSPAKQPIALPGALPSHNPASPNVARLALPAANPSAPPMHFMPADAAKTPVSSALPTATQLAVATPQDGAQNTAQALAIPIPTPAPLERSPVPADGGGQPSETVASIETEMDNDLPDDVPLPLTRPRGLPKIITEGPAEQSKPSTGPALAYARPENPLDDDEDDEGPRPLFGPRSRSGVAIYDISAHMVYLPNGERLEAHSGLGQMRDNPRYVNQKNRGPTPPHTYNLVMRESLFHGVAAIRLLPVDGSRIYGRDGLLAHTYMLGPRGDSNGCVSFKDYRRFLAAFKRGDIKRLVVVPRLSSPPTRFAFWGRRSA